PRRLPLAPLARVAPVWVFPVMQLGQAGQASPVDLVFGRGGDDAVGNGAQRGGPAAALQQGPFAHYRAGAALTALGAVDRDAEHSVKQQVDVMAGIALLGEQHALGQLAYRGLGAAAHDRGRQLPLQGAFRDRDQRLTVFLTPWAVLAVRGSHPLAEVG